MFTVYHRKVNEGIQEIVYQTTDLYKAHIKLNHLIFRQLIKTKWIQYIYDSAQASDVSIYNDHPFCDDIKFEGEGWYSLNSNSLFLLQYDLTERKITNFKIGNNIFWIKEEK